MVRPIYLQKLFDTYRTSVDLLSKNVYTSNE